ncbi:TonB-dependent receptor [Algoriphagus resistens]|uniref:TonB-dependent receptor n=1 Tax=Algoriphagus resistens TaxID=1750590 RepID=UPI000716C504|nr:TonB-dependent receptor [Algoriphagus resistens]
MRKHLLTVFLLVLLSSVTTAQTVLKGKVLAADSGEVIVGATVMIKGRLTGTVTDNLGAFELPTSVSFPLTLDISYLGYQKTSVEVSNSEPIIIRLEIATELLGEVVFSASRIEETIFQSPVTIDKMDMKVIRQTPSFSFYDGIQNLKGVDLVTSGLTYKQINTRGFNEIGNPRFLQLIDGVDNQTPGLNFAVGNLFGSNDLDMESVELIPGAASALYGPVAFNGVLMMRTKDPFLYQGLSVQAKTGINHLSEAYTDPSGIYDFSLRYAKAFNNKFAFKLNASAFKGLDWYATNYEDIDALTPPEQRGDTNPARDALNIYGDEVAVTIPDIGRVARTGYEEKDLMDYNSKGLGVNASLHYRINENMELSYGYQWGKGKAAYTGSNRFMLNNFVLQQHKLELKGSNFFVRGYMVSEDSHDSYNSRALGQHINRTWVKDLNGQIVSPDEADATWFERYGAAYNGLVSSVSGGDHSLARTFADEGRFVPGTAEYENEKNRLIHVQGLDGAGILSQSRFYHAEGQYDFSRHIGFVDLLVGGNFRLYDMFTNGTLYDDVDKAIIIKEGGAFVQVSKHFLDSKLRFTVSERYDKNQNFDGRFTPRIAGVFTPSERHSFRASYQNGFRNPTPGDQYIHLNVGPIIILGGVPGNSEGLNVYENSYTASSVGAFGTAFGQEVGSGVPFEEALMDNMPLLKQSDVDYIKPERISTFDLGYRGAWGNNFSVDINYYTSRYTDFIINTVVIRPDNEILLPDGSMSPMAAADILTGNIQAFQLYTNASDVVSSQGVSLGLNYTFSKGYLLGATGTWASFDLMDADAENVPAFNTPEFKTGVTFGNAEVTDRLGFNVAWRWQDGFDWRGTLTQLSPGRIEAYTMIDAQLSYKLPGMKSVVKIGANNLLNNQVYQAYGSPTVGGMYYISLTFDEMFR